MENSLPKAQTAMIMGILSIVLAFCCALIGLILGVVGLIMSNDDWNVAQHNLDDYADGSKLKTGRLLCKIGIGLNIAMMVLGVVLNLTGALANFQ